MLGADGTDLVEFHLGGLEGVALVSWEERQYLTPKPKRAPSDPQFLRTRGTVPPIVQRWFSHPLSAKSWVSH